MEVDTLPATDVQVVQIDPSRVISLEFTYNALNNADILILVPSSLDVDVGRFQLTYKEPEDG